MWCTIVCGVLWFVCGATVCRAMVCVVCGVLCRQSLCLPHTVRGCRLVSECKDRDKYNTRARAKCSVHIDIVEEVRGEQTRYKDR